MPITRRFLAVDIDSDIVRIIEAEKKNSVKHLMIKQIIETRLTNSNNQTDSREVRVNSVSTVIKELLQKNKIMASPVIICLPGTDAMIKYITVPPVKKQGLEQIMKYRTGQSFD